MPKITWIKEFGKRVYLTFKVWLMALVGNLVLSIVLGTILLFFLPVTVRLTLFVVYVILAEIMLFPIVRLIAGSTVQIAGGLVYNRKHKPKELYLPNRKKIAEKMNMKYDKPIYVTDNPSITGPFTNLLSRKIYFPSFVFEELHRTEIDATFGHELAHVKHAPRFVVELSLVISANWVFALLLGNYAIFPTTYILADLAFMMLMFSFVLRRNESLADWTGAKATSPEALISALQYFTAKSKRDDSSITHQSCRARKKRLERLFDSHHKFWKKRR